jgi:LacI family transcriptional regulator
VAKDLVTALGGRIKLEDVARVAGVSTATASRVLNHPEIVRIELREKVIRAMTELSYTRDGTARALKVGRMRTVGAVVPTLNISIFAEGVEALQNRLSEHGYTLFIANSQYDLRKELSEVRALLERGIDGLVLVGDTFSSEVLQLVRQHGVPLVTTYVGTARDGVPAIGIDNTEATFQLTRYLLGLGHREFGVIANLPPSNDRSHARHDGILLALADAGIDLAPERVVRATHSLAQGRSGLHQLLATFPAITAVICTTDTLAMGAIAEARSLGLAIPHDLSITGFDDIELSAQMSPALTTVSVPAAEIGRSAADHLISALAGVPIPASVQMPYRLVLRGSTGPAPGTAAKLVRRQRTRSEPIEP